MGLRDGVVQVIRVVGAGEVKDINLQSNVGASDLRSCTLSPVAYAKDEISFSLKCIGELSDDFKFLDSLTEQKYLNLFALSEEKHRENSKKEIIIFVFSLFLPLIIFIAVSGLFLLLMKLVSYVRYGSKAN